MAEGHIGSVLGTLVCNAAASGAPSVAHVYGNIYVLCWDVGSTDGYICTVSIATSAPYTIAIIETTHFESLVCLSPRIVKVAANMFAIFYEYNLAHGLVRTIGISNTGDIDTLLTDDFTFEGVDCHGPVVCKVADNVFVVVYQDTNGDGKITTVGIAGDGQITDPILDFWVFEPGALAMPAALKIASGRFAFFYQDAASDGVVKTIGISDGGDITESIVDLLVFEASTAYFIKAAHFTGNIYVAVYQDALGHGWVTTMVIAASGQIGAAYADRLNFNTGYGRKPTIVAVTSNVLAIAYEDSSSSGEIYSFWCLSDGDITQAPRDTLAFDSTLVGFPVIFHITAGIFAVAYSGPNSYITLKSFDFETGGNPKHLPLMGIG